MSPNNSEGSQACTKNRHLILHNDNYHRLNDVVQAVVNATHQAYATVLLKIITLTDRNPKVEVFEGNLEHCELVMETLKASGLTVSIH